MKNNELRQEIVFKEGKINIKYIIEYLESDGKIILAHVPAFGFYFSCLSYEDGQKNATHLFKAYFSYWKNKEWVEFIDELKRIGFLPPEEESRIRFQLKRRQDINISSNFPRRFPHSVLKKNTIENSLTF